jgi:hypothetical protein
MRHADSSESLDRLERAVAARDEWGRRRRTWLNVLIPRPWLPTLAFLMGGAILAGGPRRFVSPGFAVVRVWAPWWVWGVVFCVMGAAQLLPLPARFEWPVRYVAALPFAALAVGLGASALLNAGVALTGACVYGWASVVHLRIAAMRRQVARDLRRGRAQLADAATVDDA